MRYCGWKYSGGRYTYAGAAMRLVRPTMSTFWICPAVSGREPRPPGTSDVETTCSGPPVLPCAVWSTTIP